MLFFSSANSIYDLHVVKLDVCGDTTDIDLYIQF